MFARRQGDTWFVAVLNGPAARSLKVPLTFLDGGDYRGLLARDRAGDPAAVTVEGTTVRRGTALTLELSDGGGFIGRFTKK